MPPDEVLLASFDPLAPARFVEPMTVTNIQ